MDVDLAIVGGGPAGVATALFLVAAAPHLRDRIVILEKERYPREKICGGAIGARADRLLASIGVRVDVPGVPVEGISIATSRGTRLTRQPGVVFGRVVRRIEFDEALANAARARGVRILEGARVTGMTVEARSVRITSSIGELRARAIVGADGVGSFVRRSLGVPRGRWLAQVVEVDTPAVVSDPARDLLHFDVSDGSLLGYSWDFPTIVDGQALVCRGLYELQREPTFTGGPLDDTPARARGHANGGGASAAPDLGARLLDRLRALGVAEGVRLKRFSERGLALHEPIARPRALLIGEAAGIDPVLGEGIAQAILYGAAAGPYLARRLDADDLAFTDWPRALLASRVGFDLRVRSRAPWWIYGPTRHIAERFLATSTDIAIAGMHYFGGLHVPRVRLARAALGLGSAVASEIIDAISSGGASS